MSSQQHRHHQSLFHHPRHHGPAPSHGRDGARRGQHSQQERQREIIRRGILISFNAATYTANVLLLEANGAYLSGVPVGTHLDGTSAQVNSLCAVLFFDEQNYTDAVGLAIYPNGSQGVPTPAPGRVVFVTGYRQVNGDTINAGAINTYTLTGGSTGIPTGASGVLYKAYFSSATVGSYIQLAPHGATDISAYVSLGNIGVANNTLNENGLLAVDSSGKIDVKANVGTCTFSLFTYGYII